FGSAIAVDPSGHAYVTGTTEAPNFPLKHPFEKVPSNDVSFCGPTAYANAFVTKLSVDGGSLVYSTYLGGTCEDHGTGIAVDSQGRAYVSGWTASSSFPTSPYAFQNLLDVTEPSAFVTKFSASGETLLYSTHLGGHNGHTKATGIAEFGGNAFVTGWTEADDFPTKHAFLNHAGTGHTPHDCPGNGRVDAFITPFRPNGSSLVYSTCLGGDGEDEANAIAVGPAGRAYVTGYTCSHKNPVINTRGFPTRHAFQSNIGDDGVANAFVTKLTLPDANNSTPPA